MHQSIKFHLSLSSRHSRDLGEREEPIHFNLKNSWFYQKGRQTDKARATYYF
jgi:hypothetical protein